MDFFNETVLRPAERNDLFTVWLCRVSTVWILAFFYGAKVAFNTSNPLCGFHDYFGGFSKTTRSYSVTENMQVVILCSAFELLYAMQVLPTVPKI